MQTKSVGVGWCWSYEVFMDLSYSKEDQNGELHWVPTQTSGQNKKGPWRGEGLFVMHDRNKGVCTGCAHTVVWCEGAQSGGGDSVVWVAWVR